jgi:hypothetical protein
MSSTKNLNVLPLSTKFYLKAKVKVTLEQGTKAKRGSRGIAPLFLQPRRKMGWVVNTTPRPLYSRESDPVPIV